MLETSIILYEISLMIFFAIVGYLIAKKINKPMGMIIIIIGILIGPSFLGLIDYNETIAVLAKIGSIIILFIAGLSTDFREIFTRKSFLIGTVGGVFSFAGGALAGIALGFDATTSIFIGAALSATCIGTASATLKGIGKINTETAKIILGAGVISDVIALFILSTEMYSPSGISIMSVMTTLTFCVLFFIFTFFIGDKMLSKLIDYFDRHFGVETPKATFMLGMGLVFGFAALAEFIGLSAIVGSFFAGLALSKSFNAKFFHTGAEYVESIFSAIFYISIGIVVSISAVFSLWYAVLIITAMAIATKTIGSTALSKKLKIEKKHAARIGMGLTTRGTVASVIALQGFVLGFLTQGVYSLIVFTSLLTTIIAYLYLDYSFKGDEKKNIESHMSKEIKITKTKKTKNRIIEKKK